ncbi:MAG: MalY/PatB family protein [Eubacteriales bacterium]
MFTNNFKKVLDRRGTGSEKWNMLYGEGKPNPPFTVPLSVADMEFTLPRPIVKGLKKHLKNCVLGYTEPTDEYFREVTRWMEDRHMFSPKKEWFTLYPGVIPAIFDIISKLTEKGDHVLVTPPVYYPFKDAILQTGRVMDVSPLVIADGEYRINFDGFERACSRPEVKLFILCSPHNPVGRVWTRQELIDICDICLKHNVLVIADEIHFDLIMPGNSHVSVGTFEEKYLKNCILCTSPSKTFNLAGLQCSNIFAADEKIRLALSRGRGYFSLNAFAYPVCILAYRECGEWLKSLIKVIDENKNLIKRFIAEKIPQIKVFELQGTYLQWLDFRALRLDDKALEEFLQTKAGIFADEGYIFGEGGSGFERLNIACPTGVILDSLNRLDIAVKSLGKS